MSIYIKVDRNSDQERLLDSKLEDNVYKCIRGIQTIILYDATNDKTTEITKSVFIFKINESETCHNFIKSCHDNPLVSLTDNISLDLSKIIIETIQSK
jgi:hypothetical protein